MNKVIDNAIGIFDMMWAEESKGRNFSQPEAKAGFRTALEKRAKQIANMTVQEFFIYEINQRINDLFLSKNSGKSAPRYQSGGRPFMGKKPMPTRDSPYRPLTLSAKPIRASRLLREKVLMAAMINYPELFEEFGEQLGMISIPNEEYDTARQCLIRFLTEAEEQEIYLDDQAVKQHLIESG